MIYSGVMMIESGTPASASTLGGDLLALADHLHIARGRVEGLIQEIVWAVDDLAKQPLPEGLPIATDDRVPEAVRQEYAARCLAPRALDRIQESLAEASRILAGLRGRIAPLPDTGL